MTMRRAVLSLVCVALLDRCAAAEAFGPYPPTTTIFVDASNAGAADGSPTKPFQTIQEAMLVAATGDVVGVAAGRYPGLVTMKKGVELRGFPAGAPTIDALGAGNAVICADDAVLDGFRITNAARTGILVRARAIDCSNGASPVISNNVILDNRAVGIFLLRSSAVIRSNIITGNPAFTGSCPCDAIEAIDSSPTIVDNYIDASDANGNLQAIYLAFNNPSSMTKPFTIERNRITGRIELSNISTSVPLDHLISNYVIVRGNSFSEAINIAFSQSLLRIVNNTLVGTGGIFEQGGESNLEIINNIVVFGRSGIISGTVIGPAGPRRSTLLIRNNNVFGNYDTFGEDTNYTAGLPDQTGLDGNISLDPVFVNPADGDFRLAFGSPAIDSGTNLGCPSADQRGATRPIDGSGSGRAVCDIGAYETKPTQLVMAVLPLSRSVAVGTTASAFATVINPGGVSATRCVIAPITLVSAEFAFQTTDPATNQVTGGPNEPVDIPPRGAQTFLIAFTPTHAFDPIDVKLDVRCEDAESPRVIRGVTTLLLSASNQPPPDVVVVAATAAGHGIVDLGGQDCVAAFAIATVNVGSSGVLTAVADRGDTTLPVEVTLCRSDPATSACQESPSPTVTIEVSSGATPTFAVFVRGTGHIGPFDPANHRVFVRFRDVQGFPRGAASVAVRVSACGDQALTH